MLLRILPALSPADAIGCVCGLGGWDVQGVSLVQRRIEPAGQAFERRLMGEDTASSIDENDEDNNGSNGSTPADSDVESEDHSSTEKKRHRVPLFADMVEDPYEIMGLSHLRWKAGDADIKKAYRAMVLKYHPDKNTDVDDEVFKKIQRANDVLSNITKRRAFDSQDASFDLSPPTSLGAGQDFFEVFGPAFDAYSRWSEKKPVPGLGNANTPWPAVDKFYRFWERFKSWREHSYMNEFDLKEAEDRYERRWMDRQNEKIRKKQRALEVAAIASLRLAAEAADPRVRAHNAEVEAEKQRVKDERRRLKEERFAAERSVQNASEAERIAKEEAKRESDVQARKDNQVYKKRLRKARTLLRKATRAAVDSSRLNEDHVELLCAELDADALTRVIEDVSAAAPSESESEIMTPIVTRVQRQVQERMDEERRKGLAMLQSHSKQTETTTSRPWTEDECLQLTRLVKKYPAGTVDRWKVVAALLANRTEKEVITKVKSGSQFTPTTAGAEQYASAVAGKKTLKGDIPPPSTNFETVAKDIAEEVAHAPATSVAVPSTAAATVVATAAAATPKSAVKPKPATTPKQAAGKATVASAPAVPATPKSDPANWSVEEQALFEKAVRSCPPSLQKQRWDKIAELMPGRTKAECVARYKYLVVQKKAAQASASASAASAPAEPSAAAPASSEPKSEEAHAGSNGISKPKSDAPEDWTAEEQTMLEEAMRQFPASLGTERWEKISAQVEGRSKRACVQRVKFLAAEIKRLAAES